jgi:hypothetical protein
VITLGAYLIVLVIAGNMKFDSLNLPQENGASDLQDSARLAGIMAVFNYYPNGKFDLSLYLKNGKYVRHPSEYKYTFSRHQTLCFVAGLFVQGWRDLVDLKYVDGKDLFMPSHRGHIEICKGDTANWFQNLWTWVDVLMAAHFKKMDEPNQILCRMMLNPDKTHLKYWLKNNDKWRESILEYWCGWRNEPELAEHMIKKLEGYL